MIEGGQHVYGSGVVDNHPASLIERQKKATAPFSPMFFALILAACGGGSSGSPQVKGNGTPQVSYGDSPQVSGDGSSPQVRGLVFTRANDDTPTAQAEKGRTLIEDAAESLQSPEIKKLADKTGISITIESITVTSDSTVDIVMQADNQQPETVTIAYSGPDASLIGLVQKGPKNYEVVFKEPVDYEAPQDYNYDNVYEYTTVARMAGLTITQKYRVEILDKQDGPTTVSPSAPLSGPDFERDGTVIKVTLEEGQDLVFEQFTGDTSVSGTLSGADADKFEVETVSKGGKNVTKISFKEAPDASNHQDQGSDGVYNLEIDGALEQLWGDLQFEVTVVDVV